MKLQYIARQFAFLFFATITITACAQSKKHSGGEMRIVLIRHAEKPDDGDNLSCTGLNRSLKLPAVLKAKFGLPDHIFVPSPNEGKQTKNLRMLQTVTPFAGEYNLPINTNYNVEDAASLVKKLAKTGGTSLVVWEHKELPEIASMLGVKQVPNWKASDYDSIWIISFDNNGHASLKVDRENINPASNCNF